MCVQVKLFVCRNAPAWNRYLNLRNILLYRVSYCISYCAVFAIALHDIQSYSQMQHKINWEVQI